MLEWVRKQQQPTNEAVDENKVKGRGSTGVPVRNRVPRFEGVLGSGGVAPLNLFTKWR